MSENGIPARVQGVGPGLTSGAAIGLFAFVVVAWGLTWVVMKVAIQEISPLWAVAVRTWIAVAVLVPAVTLTGQLAAPPRSDLPVVLVISLFHMVAFAALMTAGLKHVAAGRSILLAYTTPLWVAPAAWLCLKEPLPPGRLAGIGLGLAGLLLMFDPRAFDWRDGTALLGNGLVLASALCWSVSILYTRAHRWTATPFQLILWQTLLAAGVLTALALLLEGVPRLTLSAKAMAALAYNGAIGTALGFWAMTVVNKELPAAVTSLGVLATPVIGLVLSALMLGERLDVILLVSSLLIVTGISIGTISGRAKKTP